MPHWRMMMIFKDKWNHCPVQQTSSEAPSDQCSPAVKDTLFRAYCMPMYACQLWSKCTQTSMKRLHAAYDNFHRILHHISRNVSVRPHQVSHCVRTFNALLRNNLHQLLIRCASSNFFIRLLQMSDVFYKSSFFLNYSTLMYDGATVGVLCFAPLNISRLQTPILWCAMANHFLCSCFVWLRLWYGPRICDKNYYLYLSTETLSK